MKKLIFILMVGSLFADTIKYTYKGELKVKENVTFKKADDKYIHYITSAKSFNKIECDKVVEITSTKGENIEFSCSIETPPVEKESNIEEPNNLLLDSDSHLVKSGINLIKFKNNYYTGFWISFIGSFISTGALINGNMQGAGFGSVINLIGGITMLTSHSLVAKAGEEMIKAGEELEKEKSVEKNQSELDNN